MNSLTAVEAHPAGRLAAGASEKVGLRHIHLSFARQCLRACVGSFFAADKVLLGWAMRNGGALECAYEIVYDDGRTLAGEYRYQRGATTRPALMAFVRKTLKALCEGRGHGVPVRGLVDGASRFMAHYETDDFAVD